MKEEQREYGRIVSKALYTKTESGFFAATSGAWNVFYTFIFIGADIGKILNHFLPFVFF